MHNTYCHYPRYILLHFCNTVYFNAVTVILFIYFLPLLCSIAKHSSYLISAQNTCTTHPDIIQKE